MLKTLKPHMVILHTKFNSNYDRKSRKRKCRMGLACGTQSLQLHGMFYLKSEAKMATCNIGQCVFIILKHTFLHV